MPDASATVPQTALERSRELEAQGRVREAIDLVTSANREHRSSDLECRLVELRHLAPFPPPVGTPPAPVTAEDPLPLVDTAPGDLDLATLRRGLAHHGCVLVRGLVDPDRAARLSSGIDRALDAFDLADGGGSPDPAWYSPFVPRPGPYRVGGRRRWVRASGAVWTADSPRMLFELGELIEETGIGDLVTEYLGERPALSANKCTLRRVPLTAQPGWHQDGAFLGEAARTLNLWLALDHCGTDAPGIDIVPRRFDHVVPAGTEGAMFDWSVAPDVVAEVADGVEVQRPTFAPGDALLFDHLLLHSTALTDAMTRERHAMETWFFAPSAYPEGQIPLTW